MSEFYYLGGPMTGYPCYNFPRFREVASTLRKQGYTIVSPAELDDEETSARIMASEDGLAAGIQAEYNEFLGRDLFICARVDCIGGIFLEGWNFSNGAQKEAALLRDFGKEIYVYDEDEAGFPILQMLSNDLW